MSSILVSYWYVSINTVRQSGADLVLVYGSKLPFECVLKARCVM